MPVVWTIQLWFRKRKYTPGRRLWRFVARDVRRDLIVVSASRIEQDLLTVRIKTNNVLYVSKGLVEPNDYGEAIELNINKLWSWSGSSWGGQLDGTSIASQPILEPPARAPRNP